MTAGVAMAVGVVLGALVGGWVVLALLAVLVTRNRSCEAAEKPPPV